jgi:RNA polymerase sigma-70 factor (ECF subfamily)
LDGEAEVGKMADLAGLHGRQVGRRPKKEMRLPCQAATRDGTNLSAWLHRIAANACLDVLRRRQRLRWLPWDGPKHDHLLWSDPADDPERAAVGAEARAAVRRALAGVSPRHQRALTLRAYDGLSCAEIGAAMGLSRAAVKSLLFRACLELRAVYAAAEWPGGETTP